MSFGVERHQPGGPPFFVPYPAMSTVNESTPATKYYSAIRMASMQRGSLFHSGKYKPSAEALTDRVGPKRIIKISLGRSGRQQLVCGANQPALSQALVRKSLGKTRGGLIPQFDRAHWRPGNLNAINR
jgi:hypothetical protein